jgi:hypothetical protein
MRLWVLLFVLSSSRSITLNKHVFRSKITQLHQSNIAYQLSHQSSTSLSKKSLDVLPRKKSASSTVINVLFGFFYWSWLILRKAHATVITGEAINTRLSTFQGVIIWACLFLLSAALHSAESAITKISPWKVISIFLYISHCNFIFGFRYKNL